MTTHYSHIDETEKRAAVLRAVESVTNAKRVDQRVVGSISAILGDENPLAEKRKTQPLR